jgi:hypothetical protein
MMLVSSLFYNSSLLISWNLENSSTVSKIFQEIEYSRSELGSEITWHNKIVLDVHVSESE